MMTKPRAKDPPTPAVMFSLITGRFVSHLIDVAARLELADLLKGGPRTVEDLAAAANVQAPALYRVLRALASVGIFAETTGRRFRLTPLAATLQKNVPGSLHPFALMINENLELGCLAGALLWNRDRRVTVSEGPWRSGLRVSRETPRGPQGLRRIDDKPLHGREPENRSSV